MPCHESHTRGPGVDDLQADQNDPARLLKEAGAARRADGKRRMTDGKDPVETLGRIYDLTIPDPDWPISDEAIVNRVRKIAHTALIHAAAPVEPRSGDGFSRREALLIALNELFDCDFRSIPPDEWQAAVVAFQEARSELQCPDGCDTSCPCYQEGLEKQREP